MGLIRVMCSSPGQQLRGQHTTPCAGIRLDTAACICRKGDDEPDPEQMRKDMERLALIRQKRWVGWRAGRGQARGFGTAQAGVGAGVGERAWG